MRILRILILGITVISMLSLTAFAEGTTNGGIETDVASTAAETPEDTSTVITATLYDDEIMIEEADSEGAEIPTGEVVIVADETVADGVEAIAEVAPAGEIEAISEETDESEGEVATEETVKDAPDTGVEDVLPLTIGAATVSLIALIITRKKCKQ